jgi:hypothetical protein
MTSRRVGQRPVGQLAALAEEMRGHVFT